MPQSLLEMAKELIQAEIEAGQLSVEDMPDALQKTYASLMTLQAKETGTIAPPPSPTAWRKSITKYTITCLECGRTFKQLNGRHLREHGLDSRSYRDKYGIPRTQSLAARETTALRRQIVMEIKPWEKAPAYVQAQEAKATAPKKSGRKKGAQKR
jgi:predicted transcriptional regulator